MEFSGTILPSMAAETRYLESWFLMRRRAENQYKIAEHVKLGCTSGIPRNGLLTQSIFY